MIKIGRRQEGKDMVFVTSRQRRTVNFLHRDSPKMRWINGAAPVVQSKPELDMFGHRINALMLD